MINGFRLVEDAIDISAASVDKVCLMANSGGPEMTVFKEAAFGFLPLEEFEGGPYSATHVTWCLRFERHDVNECHFLIGICRGRKVCDDSCLDQCSTSSLPA